MLPNAECSATFRNFLLFKFFWWLIYTGLKFKSQFDLIFLEYFIKFSHVSNTNKVTQISSLVAKFLNV